VRSRQRRATRRPAASGQRFRPNGPPHPGVLPLRTITIEVTRQAGELLDQLLPRPNVWYGATVEGNDQRYRIEALRAVPAAVHFLSCEPLLERLDLAGRLDGIAWVIAGGESGAHARPMHPEWARVLRDQCQAAGVAFHLKQWGEWLGVEGRPVGDRVEFAPEIPLDAIGKMRRWDGDTHRSAGEGETVRSFLAAGTFSVRVGKKTAGRLLDGRTWDELPA